MPTDIPIALDWMYRHLDVTRTVVADEFFDVVDDFILRAQMHTSSIGESSLILCPCSKCKNIYPNATDKVHQHIVRCVFVEDYYCWVYHGESLGSGDNSQGSPANQFAGDEYHEMVGDGLGFREPIDEGEAPNGTVAGIKLLRDTDELIYEGCTTMSKLALVSELINLKSESRISKRNHERYVSIMRQLRGERDIRIPSIYWQAKKLLMPLCLPHRKIDACVDNCMLFYGDAAILECCLQCGKSGYNVEYNTRKGIAQKVLNYFPIGPRLQRLYMLGKTAKNMTWHYRNPSVDDFMTHPSHGGACKHFDNCHLEFALEPRNVRVGLCTDGFIPYDKFARNYSCWPVMVCVYNLPPGLCMKDPSIFIALIIHVSRSPGRDLDVFMRLLFDDLNHLCGDGVVTYDAEKRVNFTMLENW